MYVRQSTLEDVSAIKSVNTGDVHVAASYCADGDPASLVGRELRCSLPCVCSASLGLNNTAAYWQDWTSSQPSRIGQVTHPYE